MAAVFQVPHQGDNTAACPVGLQSLRQEHGLNEWVPLSSQGPSSGILLGLAGPHTNKIHAALWADRKASGSYFNLPGPLGPPGPQG